MARSNNPFPKAFSAWYVRNRYDTLLVTCRSDNGWYRIFEQNTLRDVGYRSLRWYELDGLVLVGKLVPIASVPEDDIDTMEEVI